jgi:hypothetical protein
MSQEQDATKEYPSLHIALDIQPLNIEENVSKNQ